MSGMISATEMNSRYKKQDNRHRCQTRNADAVLARYIRNSQDRCYAEGGDQAVITDPDIIFLQIVHPPSLPNKAHRFMLFQLKKGFKQLPCFRNLRLANQVTIEICHLIMEVENLPTDFIETQRSIG